MTYNLVNTKDTLPRRLNDFLNYLKTMENKSIRTIEGYKIDLRLMFRFLKIKKLNINDIQFEDVDISDIDDNFITTVTFTDLCNFVSFLEQKGNVATTRARKIATIKSFYCYLVKINLISIQNNPARNLDTPQIGKRNPIYLTIDESKQLLNLDSMKWDVNYKRDYCIITLLLNCGLRNSELCNINFEDIKEDSIRIIGKGNKERVVYLNDMCVKALNQWAEERKLYGNLIMNNEDKKALFIGKKYTRLKKQGVEGVVKKWIKEAGLSEEITPHKLRHSAATSKYKSGVDIRAIQKMLGHSNISTTTIYTHVDEEQLREASNNNPFL